MIIMKKKEKKEKKNKSNIEIRQDKQEVKEKVKEFLIRAHSFQEVGTEVLDDKDYDVLHFPHLILAMGVIMSIYGYFIIILSTELAPSPIIEAYQDGLAALIAGNVIATIGMLRLLKKYWGSFIILLLLNAGLITILLALWNFLLTGTSGTAEDFWNQTILTILTTLTFAYTACFVWYIGARYTSSLYFRLFSGGKSKANKFFIVDPWRKTLSNKGALIKDILGRTIYPFLFLLSVIMSITEAGGLYFAQLDWDKYFQSVLIIYLLLCAMVVIFPALWLLDYVRYIDENRLEVRSMGQQVLFLVKGYAGFGIFVTFFARSQSDLFGAIMELLMLTIYLIPSLILLIGGYVLLTERDVYYIASKVAHGDVVVVNYKLIDSFGEELKWWLGSKKKQRGGSSQDE
jgi:hypothetical protein